MATPSISKGNPSSNSSSGPNTDNSRWRRSEGEGGSNFRGGSKGGRGGGGGGRRSGRSGNPGRGGRAGGEPSGTDSGTQSKQEVPSTPANPEPGPSAAAATQNTSDKRPTTPSRPKGPSRRPSRNAVPAVVIAPPAEPAPSPSTPSRPSNRRRRSNQKVPNSATVPTKASGFPPPLKDPSNRPIKPGTLNPPHSAPPAKDRDVPPHLQSSRSNIDAVVERMRAAAMSDHRPSTPGSHIDWAGDDGDELPDLDDWGVSNNNSTNENTNANANNEISPIMVEGLKPLPEPVAKPLSPPNSAKKAPGLLPSLHIPPSSPTNAVIDRTSPREEPRAKLKSDKVDNWRRGGAKPTTTNKSAPSSATEPKHQIAAPVGLPAKPLLVNAALHPSLPAKPTAAAESAALPPKLRDTGATPMRSPVSPSPSRSPAHDRTSPSKSPHSPAKDQAKAAPQPEPVVASGVKLEQEAPKPREASRATEEVDRAPEAQPEVQAMSPAVEREKTDQATKSASSEPESRRQEGLSASIYAPGSDASSDNMYAPTPTGPRNFYQTHNRASTLGRQAMLVPHSAPGGVAGGFGHRNPRLSRSGHSTPRGGGVNHARTHSSPPTGSGHRTAHSRPVITGDAISRLARSIGGMGISAARSAPAVNVVKE